MKKQTGFIAPKDPPLATQQKAAAKKTGAPGIKIPQAKNAVPPNAQTKDLQPGNTKPPRRFKVKE